MIQQDRNLNTILRDIAVYGVVLGLMVAGGIYLENRKLERIQTEEREDVRQVAEDVARNLGEAISQKFIVAAGVSGAISLSPDLNQEEFTSLVAPLTIDNPSLINVASLRDMTITHVFPVMENADLIGKDISDVPEQRAIAERAQETGRAILQGPIRLLQGMDGFIIREPVFVRDDSGVEVIDPSVQYWGLISMVFAAEPFYERAGLDALQPNFVFAIRNPAGPGGGTILGDQALFEGSAIRLEVPFASGSWQLALAPARGWTTVLPGLGVWRALFVTLLCVSFLFVRSLLRLVDNTRRVTRQLRDAIEVLPDGFVVFDRDDRLVMCNRQYKAFYAKSAEAMFPGNSFENILRHGLKNGQYPEAKGREEEWLRERLERHQQSFSQVEQQLEDGRWLRIIEQATPEGGRAGVRLDITAIKQNELELEDSNALLKAALEQRDAAEARFAAVWDISTEWFWEQDEEHRFTYLSQSFQRSTGIDPETVIGTRRSAFAQTKEGATGADTGLARIVEAMENREPFQDFIYQPVGLTSGGQEMWIRTSGLPFYDAEGRFKGYRGTAADVTPLYVALQKAQAADLAKTQFLNVVSHELRTPLSVLLGYNKFLTRPEILPSVKALLEARDEKTEAEVDAMLAEIRTYAERMDFAGNQLLSLVSDMLDLARIESNTIKLKRERVELRRRVESVVEQLTPLAGEKGLYLRLKVKDCAVHCDPARLNQILTNLIGNAIKFTDAGEVRVSCRPEGDMAVFIVEDTGVGIPEEHLPVVFDQFRQVDTSFKRNRDGVGLGLAITRELVQLHGGRISVESTLDEGSRFTFSLPLWREDAVEHRE